MAVPHGAAMARVAEDVVERAVGAWLEGAGQRDRAATETRLRFARALINRLEVGFARDAELLSRLRDPKKEESAVEWMRRELSMSANAARAAVTVGEFADKLPLSVAATDEGRIGFGHLAQIADTAVYAGRIPAVTPDGELVIPGDERPPVWDERALLAKAQKQPIGKFATTCLHVQHELDAAAAVQRFRTQSESQRIYVWVRNDGSVRIHGWWDAEWGAIVMAAVQAIGAPRLANDTRTTAQRTAEAFGEMAAMALDSGRLPEVNGVRPHLTVTVGVDALMNMEAAAAETDMAIPFTDHTARRLACDALISKVVTDQRNVPLTVGREQRVVSPALRRALVVRDRGCRWPGCGAPPARCQAHHVVHWIDGGETSLANCCLLCRRHHRELHEGEWELHGDVAGELTVSRHNASDMPRHHPRDFRWIDPPDPGATPRVDSS